jgi:hypothetical protein
VIVCENRMRAEIQKKAVRKIFNLFIQSKVKKTGITIAIPVLIVIILFQ